jgi:hypothetical protein
MLSTFDHHSDCWWALRESIVVWLIRDVTESTMSNMRWMIARAPVAMAAAV